MWQQEAVWRIRVKTEIPSLVRAAAEIKEAVLKKNCWLARYRDLDKVDIAQFVPFWAKVVAGSSGCHRLSKEI